MFNATDWYWYVGQDTSKVYSSKRNIFVSKTDQQFLAWSEANGSATPPTVATQGEIWDYVKYLQPAWVWDDKAKAMAQPAVGQYTKGQLQNYNGLKRFEKVGGGMTAAGVPIKTDERSRGFVQGGMAQAQADPSFSTKWFGSDGNFYDVDATTMISMGDQLGKHTNQCYLIFSDLSSKIDLGTVTTTDQIDEAYEDY